MVADQEAPRTLAQLHPLPSPGLVPARLGWALTPLPSVEGLRLCVGVGRTQDLELGDVICLPASSPDPTPGAG